MQNARRTTLGLALLASLKKHLEDSWLYLPSSDTPTAETECLIVPSSEEESEEIAKGLGFPQEGLDSQTLEDVAGCAARFEPLPSDGLLVESFVYYWRFDAFLPAPGAPEPLPREEAALRQAREFYESLGAERAGTKCKNAECSRGAVALSVYCRVHHFEMMRKAPCPFTD